MPAPTSPGTLLRGLPASQAAVCLRDGVGGEMEVPAGREARVGPSSVFSLNYVEDAISQTHAASVPGAVSWALSFLGNTHELPLEVAVSLHLGTDLVQGTHTPLQ